MKTNKIPSVFVLWLYSWAIGLAGLLAGAYVIVFGEHDARSIAFGFLIILGSGLCAALVRALANLTQMTFDHNSRLDRITDHLSKLTDNVEYINCDSKDLNQSVHEVRDFFEKIQRHLDINK